METKFSIGDKVVFLNCAEMRFEEDVVKGIRVIPTNVSRNEQGEEAFDAVVVLYEMKGGLVLTEQEVFSDKDAAKSWYLDGLSSL